MHTQVNECNIESEDDTARLQGQLAPTAAICGMLQAREIILYLFAAPRTQAGRLIALKTRTTITRVQVYAAADLCCASVANWARGNL